MKKWKVVIVCAENELEVIVEAEFYSDAYNQVRKKYTGCKIKSLTVIRANT
jgi:hypothetical protein